MLNAALLEKGFKNERFRWVGITAGMVSYVWIAKRLIREKKIWRFKNIRIRVDVYSKATSILSENEFLKPKMKT